MHFRRSDLPHVLTVVILASVAAVIAGANHIAARLKSGNVDRTVDTRPIAPMTSRDGLQQTIDTMEARLRTHPADARSAALLADALMRQVRITGHAGLVLRAEHALLRVLHDEPADYEARRMLATVYLSEHRFRDAIREAARARDERPRDDWNYGVMGDGHLELGEYDEAFASFKRMMDLRPTAAAYARVSYALELQGKLDAAIEAMRLSTDATPPTDLESIAWHHAQLGDLHREAGRFDRAVIEYAWAEHAFPGHPFADLGKARLAEAKGDLVSALAAYEKVSATAPTPDVHARLGELYDRLGRTDDAAREYALAEASWRTDAPQPAALARFLAERGQKVDEAVRLAESAAAERRDIFTEDALAWCYFKAGRLSDAASAMARAQRTGTRDQSIRAHAAAISRALHADAGN